MAEQSDFFDGRDKRDVVREFIQNSLDGEIPWAWQQSPLGKLCAYLDIEQMYQVNIWHSPLQDTTVCPVHSHVAGYTFWVLSGQIVNKTYREVTEDALTKLQAVHPVPLYRKREETNTDSLCGLLVQTRNTHSSEPLSTPIHEQITDECYPVITDMGSTYTQEGEIIHQTYYTEGAITLAHSLDDSGSFYYRDGNTYTHPISKSVGVVSIRPLLERAANSLGI